MNDKEFKTMKLNAYNKIVVSAEVEEDFDDIHVAIKYSDHGDDYLYIETKDGKRFMYGFFCNLKHHTKYEDLKPVEEGKDGFLRNPVMVVKDMDEHAEVSNKLFFALEREFKKSNMSFYFDEKCYSKEEAQRRFERGLDAFERAFNSNSFYDYSKKVGEIAGFLIDNGIDTPENIELLKNAHLSSKVNGIDGIAGKKEVKDKVDELVGDRVTFAMIDGKEVDVKTLLYYSSPDYDEWGYSPEILPLDQFDSDCKTKYQSEIKDRINALKEKLDELEKGIDEYSLSSLNDLRCTLNERCFFEYWNEEQSEEELW